MRGQGRVVRPCRVRIAFAEARYVALTVPWGAVLAGCAAGLAISLVARWLAHPSQNPTSITLTVRAAYVPVIACFAFLPADPQASLATTLPVPSWLTVLTRLMIALPLLAMTAYAILRLGESDLRVAISSSAATISQLPQLALVSELAGCMAIALAAGAIVARTQWDYLGGAVATPVALAVIALFALLPWHLLPSAFTSLTPPQRAAWNRAEWAWWWLSALMSVIACFALGDSWNRWRLKPD